MRIATLNIWCRRGPWADRLALIRGELRQLAPEVVALQEVIRDRDGCQAHEIAAGLGHTVAYAPAAFRQGNALLSAHPVLEQQVLVLPGADRAEPRALLCVRLDTPRGELPVFVTHLAWKANESALRLEQVRFIAERVAEFAPPGSGLPPVLAGDFNAGPGTPEIAHLTDSGWTDAWAHAGDGTEGFTFHRRNDYAREWNEPDQRLDYLFVRNGKGSGPGPGSGDLVPKNTRLAFTNPVGGVWPSDHFGVVTDLH
ncbi:endonuclease/exonuclease/phosphatase family protein [Streptomyces sp. NPDC059373]